MNLLAAFSGFGSLSLLTVAMDLVERNGLGKILAEPTLVARSGEMASFLAGGEVPIPIAQGGAPPYYHGVSHEADLTLDLQASQPRTPYRFFASISGKTPYSYW